MAQPPHTPVTGSSNSFGGQYQAYGSNGTLSGPGTSTRTPTSSSSSGNTYLLPISPMKGRRFASDNYKPKILRTCGQRPACLVNASVTYCGDNKIYAFGGFDHDTDEGSSCILDTLSLI